MKHFPSTWLTNLATTHPAGDIAALPDLECVGGIRRCRGGEQDAGALGV